MCLKTMIIHKSFIEKLPPRQSLNYHERFSDPTNRRFSLDENLLKLCKNLGDINQSAVRSFLIILKGVIMTPGSQQPAAGNQSRGVSEWGQAGHRPLSS